MFGRRRFASVQSVRHLAGTQTLRLVFLAVVGLSLLAAGPVVAQESNQSAQGATNPICQEDADTLATMLEGFVQLTTGLGIMGLLVVWQADSLMEMFTLSREQKTAIKQHKRGALKSAGVLVLLGPLFTIAGSMMGLPIAECVNLMPF
jgi:hypothetical protein